MTQPDYKLHMNIKYDYLEKINFPNIVTACIDKWFNQTFCKRGTVQKRRS